MTASNIDTEISDLLIEDEEILISASQDRIVPGGSISTPNAIYVTNMRIIFKDARWLGMKADIIDLNYQDISNIRLSRGVLSTEIYLKARYHSDEVKLPAVSKNVAAQIHAMIQRGIRGDLARPKTATSANTKNIDIESSFQSSPVQNQDYLERLEKIMDWKQKALITDAEFQKLKSDLLANLSDTSDTMHKTAHPDIQQSPINSENTESSNILRPTAYGTHESLKNDNIRSVHTDQIASDLDTYENSRLGIEIKFPRNWKLSEKEYYPDHPDEKWSQVIGLISPSEINTGSNLENVALYVKDLPTRNTTIDAYAEKQIIHLTKKCSVQESSLTTFASGRAHKVVYADKKGCHILEVWTIKGNNLYTIRCTAKPQNFSGYLPLFQKMIDSFEIT